MKIALVTTFFHPITGGVESHVLSLARRLAADGHKVDVLCSDSNKNGPKISEKISNLGEIRIVRFRTVLSLSYFHKFFPGILNHLLKKDYDLIHVHGARKVESYFALYAGSKKNIPVILTTHNPFAVSSREGFSKYLIDIHDKTIGKRWLAKFDKIITIVPSESKLLQEKFGVPEANIVNIPNGLESEFYKKGNAERFFQKWNIDPKHWHAIVVGAGRMNYVKGFQHLEAAIDKLRNVLFFFAGGDDGYLEKLHKQYRKKDNVIFSNVFLRQEQLLDMYTAADVFVFPSLHEAFGIVLLEAMAAGLPIVSTNKGGPRELFTNDEMLFVNPKDETSWTEMISLLLTDQERREHLSKHALEKAQEFSWDNVYKQINDLYQSLSKKSKR